MPGPQTQHKGTVYGDDEHALYLVETVTIHVTCLHPFHESRRPRSERDLAVMARARAFLVLAAATAVHGLVLLRPAPIRRHSLAAQTCHVPGKCAQVRPPARRCPNAFAFTCVIQSATARMAGAEVGG